MEADDWIERMRTVDTIGQTVTSDTIHPTKYKVLRPRYYLSLRFVSLRGQLTGQMCGDLPSDRKHVGSNSSAASCNICVVCVYPKNVHQPWPLALQYSAIYTMAPGP